ncbi:glyoxylate reductase [Clathrospora elynae]|uniref:Glyoxylate reductase n=1 Tax=Clathrospora elynae TaxID=706981 RepID=A0A6A5SWF4_9PLEO|nr:glyoxylate reductase [Clathrospora elynae]
MRPKVLLLGQIEHAVVSWNSLSSVADVVKPTSRNRSEFLAECKSGVLDDVVVIYRTFESVDLTGRFDEELVSSLPGSVRFVCHNGAGYDQIDVDACSERGIKVSHAPNAVNDATADAAIFLMLGALRRFNVPMTALRKGHWRGYPPPPLGHDPQGKTLGILGMGGIGRNMKKKAEVFGICVVYHNRNRLSKELAAGAEYVSFEDLLARSDIISINIPLNVNTRHMISTREFEQMKDGMVLVNTARGAVIDEGALVKALDSGKVASIGLDVYEQEPSIHWGLKANPNVVLLPHMGTWTVETQSAMEQQTIGNVRSALETGALRDLVPEQARHE